MSKQVLIGLLAVSVLAMWGSVASAFNRINGIIIRHSTLYAEVTLCADPLQTTQLSLDLKVDIQSQKEDVLYEKEPVVFHCRDTKEVLSTDFIDPSTPNCKNATALIIFKFDLFGKKCSSGENISNEFKEISELEGEITSVDATARWECIGTTGVQCPPSKDGRTLIEEVKTTCSPDDAHTLLCEMPEHTSDIDSLESPSQDVCMKGGWMNLVDSQGNSFKNQGDCVSFVATGGKNLDTKKP
jgi:hypothetical protein